jgi:hypothetical protein
MAVLMPITSEADYTSAADYGHLRHPRNFFLRESWVHCPVFQGCSPALSPEFARLLYGAAIMVVRRSARENCRRPNGKGYHSNRPLTGFSVFSWVHTSL